MCGFPYSGKSIFSKEVAAKTSIVRVSFDDMWCELIAKIPELTYDMALLYVEKRITEYLRKGHSVIYDSTNLKADHRMLLVYLAEKVGAKGVVLYIPTTVDETLRRREQSVRDGTHHLIDQENVDKAFEHLEVPADAVVLASEEDKGWFLEELLLKFPRG